MLLAPHIRKKRNLLAGLLFLIPLYLSHATSHFIVNGNNVKISLKKTPNPNPQETSQSWIGEKKTGPLSFCVRYKYGGLLLMTAFHLAAVADIPKNLYISMVFILF